MAIQTEPALYSEKSGEKTQDRLLFVYDTLKNPVTFDFLFYLHFAESLRKKLRKSYIDILLVPRPNLNATREKHYVEAIGDDNIIWRITNLLVPISRLYESVGRVYIADTDMVTEIIACYNDVHPQGYSYSVPKTAHVRWDDSGYQFGQGLTVAKAAQKIIEEYIPLTEKRRIVTITLRTYDYIPVRNSNVASWLAFARDLDDTKLRVIFVPDASTNGVRTLKELTQFEICDFVCWNIELRAALYQRAWMNMGVNCGPLMLSALMDNVFTVAIDRTLDCPEGYLNHILNNGFIPGRTPHFLSKTCRFYPGQDNKETLLKIFSNYAS